MAKLRTAQIVDAYAELKAAQARLDEQEKDLKAKLLLVAKRDEDGLLVAESASNRITISEVEASEVFDSAKAKALLSAKQIRQCLKIRPAGLRYLCKARVIKAVAA